VLRFGILIGLSLLASRVTAQPTEPLEYYLPPSVQDTIAAYVASLPPAKQDSAFIVWRGRQGDAYELAVVAGEQTLCDSLLLARTNRIARITGIPRKLIFSDDDTFVAHGWTELGGESLPWRCASLRHGLFVVRFDLARSRVLSSGREH
jgi:hypothetical protein